MPFNSFAPHAFTATSIRAHAPASPGVYGLSNSRHWILIESCDNIQAALAGLLANPELGRHEPAGFVFEICQGESGLRRRDALVLEYSPVCNSAQRSTARSRRSWDREQ